METVKEAHLDLDILICYDGYNLINKALMKNSTFKRPHRDPAFGVSRKATIRELTSEQPC